MKRRLIKKGEALAILPEAVRTGPDAMWWDYWTPIPENERVGADQSIAVVHVRGSLDHHRGYGCDSYEAILDRVTNALSGQDVVATARRKAYWAEEGSPDSVVPEASPPKAVVLRIDSPGGVCSGLNQTVFALRRMSKEHGIPLIAYVDELAASAAYAIACGCDEIVLPPSAICGSVGVISTMYDQVEADKKMGIRVVTLTSGARKADGHPHVAISEEAMAAEQRRVDRLARQFFKIVASARPVSVKDVAGYQAGIFLGQEAVGNGLADAVMRWDQVVAALSEDSGGVNTKPLDAVRQRETTSTVPTTAARAATEKPMSLTALQALVKRTKSQAAAEKDPKKRAALTTALATYVASVEAYKKTKYVKETEEEESSEEEEDEAAEEKGNETDRKEDDDGGDSDDDSGGDDSDDDEEDDEEEEEESESEEESSKKAAASLATLAAEVTGKKGKAAIGALAALLEQGKRNTAIVEKLLKEQRAEKKAAAISAALNAHRITRHEANKLGGKPMSFVRSFLEMRPKAIVNTDDESVHIPNPNAKGDGAGLSAEIMKSIDEATAHAPDGVDRAALRKSMIASHEKRMSAALNGAGGRY